MTFEFQGHQKLELKAIKMDSCALMVLLQILCFQ